MYTGAKKYRNPYLINTIEMRSLWMKIEYIKSAARLLNKDWVNKRGLDLSEKVLWVSVGQGAADLWAVKVGGKKKFCHLALLKSNAPLKAEQQNFFQTSNFDGWSLSCNLTERDSQHLIRKI